MKIGTLDISNLCVGGSQASAAYLGSTQVWSQAPPPGYIFYDSTDNNIVVPNVLSGFGANIVSNEYIGGGTCKITFDGTVTAIPDSAFSGCTRLVEIEVPDTVQTLGSNAFRGCSGLTDVIVYSGITSIGSYCFWECSGITSFDIPNTVTTIDARAFGKCSGLTTVTIPSSVTTIGETAFGVTNLSSVTIPDSVTSLGQQAFLDCKNLASATIGTGITALSNYVLGRCDALTTINYNGAKSQWNSITKGSNWNLGIPATVVHCTDGEVLLEIPVPLNKLYYTTTDRQTTTFTNSSSLSITSNAYNSGVGVFTFSSNLTKLPDSAFTNNNTLKAVYIPSGVTAVGKHAFANCPNLEFVSFYEGGQTVTFSARTFESSTKITTIKMPEHIAFSSSEYNFNTDTALKYMNTPVNLPQVVTGLYNRCYSLTELHLPSTISNTIGVNAMRFDYSLMNLSFDGTTTNWNGKTKGSDWNKFVPATGITCSNGIATIDDSFTVGGRTLNTNKSMIAITTAASDVVDGYDTSVFMALTGASNTSIIFLSDNSVITSVGNRTFYQSSLLAELRLPPSLTTISQGFCDSCPNLYRLVYCGTMAQWKALWQNSIGSETAVVANCPNLKEVECKDGVLEVINS